MKPSALFLIGAFIAAVFFAFAVQDDDSGFAAGMAVIALGLLAVGVLTAVTGGDRHP